MKEAMYWQKLSDEAGQCVLCPHMCRIREGRAGLCRSRAFYEGRLTALGYGRMSSMHVDPMEKKPLYHFHPGSPVFSIGGWGCNFSCVFCQNASISQQGPERQGGDTHTPEQVMDMAAQQGCVAVAYTYNEPLVNFEFVLDCARLAREKGMINVLVTNGYVNPGPAAELLPLVDAMNVDIKCIEDDFYARQCHGSLQPVLDFCVQARAAGSHIEITNLVIPNLNDQAEQIAELAAWVKQNLGEKTPLHLSAYRPEYRLRTPATPRAIMDRAYAAAAAILPYVYLGNMLADHGSSTRCPECKAILIRRSGFTIQKAGLNEAGACRQCGRPADVVG
jgi:pyruvate formate lyase activating enzyme